MRLKAYVPLRRLNVFEGVKGLATGYTHTHSHSMYTLHTRLCAIVYDVCALTTHERRQE